MPIDTSNIEAITREIAEAQARMKEAAKVALKDGFRLIFEEYPFLGRVAWAQYTPYFNDGDPCEFSTHEIVFDSVADRDHEDAGGFWEDGPEFYSKAKLWGDTSGNDPLFVECRDTVNKLLSTIPQESFRELFGDHVSVEITRDGVAVEDYDHD